MQVISEEQSAALVSHELAFAAAREALIAAAGTGAAVYPPVIAHASSSENRFSVKAGASAELAGVKIGSYWLRNAQLGLPRHNSLILLFDQRTGRIAWAIEAGEVNAYRTAAADAVAADALARPDAEVLAIFGAGHQALYECLALARIRPLRRLLVVARNAQKAEALVSELRARGLEARTAAAHEACAEADMIVSATAATSPLFDNSWIRPGTHIASMGSDAVGKQELPPDLLDHAALFCDLPSQALAMGEFQHARGDRARVTAIGDVLEGRTPGRVSRDQITVFDSSGIALQDLYIARHLIAVFTGVTEPDRLAEG